MHSVQEPLLSHSVTAQALSRLNVVDCEINEKNVLVEASLRVLHSLCCGIKAITVVSVIEKAILTSLDTLQRKAAEEHNGGTN